MDFEEWEPVYERILADFGYDRQGDEHARDVLLAVLEEMTSENERCRQHDALSHLDFTDETVAVAGAASTLEDELDVVETATSIVAASDAARRLRDVGFHIDCMVTDLDKSPGTARELTIEGTPVAVHAHGDNVPLLELHVPRFEVRSVIPTTQASPNGPVRNYGGFTDGDRAAFLADAVGAARLVFPGWEFDDPAVSAEKHRKLEWAARLLRWLERRRNERFGVLDGRRDALDRYVSRNGM